MNAEIWGTIGTIVATLALAIVPGVVYAWYALEHIIGDKKSYARVTAEVDPTPITPRARAG